jgi:hypothetical protein
MNATATAAYALALAVTVTTVARVARVARARQFAHRGAEYIAHLADAPTVPTRKELSHR